MNATAIAPKSANFSLKRIQTVSRTLKVLFILFLLGTVSCDPFWYAFIKWLPQGSYSKISDTPFLTVSEMGLSAGLLVMLVITFWRLLSLYETGTIFSARNVQLLRQFGYLTFGFGLLRVWGPGINWAWRTWWETYSYSILGEFFLMVILGLISSPWIIGGVAVIMIARIMDEGRKIQDEQELTV